MINLFSFLPEGAYSPESHALADYFADSETISLTLFGANADLPIAGEFDAEYVRMGFRPFWRKSIAPEIHDYASSSTGKFRTAKDTAKRYLSQTPILRSFLTDDVKEAFRFRDEVPHILRDMGVPDSFLNSRREAEPEYDFFYAGSITSSRGSGLMLEQVERQGFSILLAGEPDAHIRERFRHSRSIEFAGRVGRRDIPKLAERCRYGINYTPNIAPYSWQTSTKVLEYLALGLPVVTNDYRWVRSFEASSGASTFKFTEDFCLDGVEEFAFAIPDMYHYSWKNVLDRSGIGVAVQGAIAAIK